MKLVWKIVSGDNTLWTQVLEGRYKKNDSWPYLVEVKDRDSFFWKGLVKLWNCTINEMGKAVRNGSSTLFWKDGWVGDSTSQEKALQPIPENMLNLKVVDLVTDARG